MISAGRNVRHMPVVFASLSTENKDPLHFRGFLIEPNGTVVGSNGFVVTIVEEALEAPGQRILVACDKNPPKAAVVTALDLENQLLYHTKGVEKGAVQRESDYGLSFPDYKRILSNEESRLAGSDASVSWLNLKQIYPVLKAIGDFEIPWRYVGVNLARLESGRDGLYVYSARMNWKPEKLNRCNAYEPPRDEQQEAKAA
jgi:hypothetical protein